MPGTQLGRRPLLVIICALTALLSLTHTATAQTAAAGPIVFQNSTSKPIILTNVAYIDRLGTKQNIDGEYTVKAGFFGYLREDNNKIIASKLSADVKTDDGVVAFTWTSRGLDKDGDVVFLFNNDTLNTHRQALGKTPLVPSGPSEEQVKRGVVKVLGAILANAIANREPKDLVEALIIEAARAARNTAIQGALQDLFPQLNGNEVGTARNLIIAVLEGDQIAAEDEIIKGLRRANPDFAQAAEVARFILRVREAQRR